MYLAINTLYKKMSKKIKATIIISTLCMGIILSGTKVFATTGKILNDTTRVRKTASTKAEIVEVLDKGKTVEVEKEDGDWYKVSFKVGKKTIEGYIRNDLIEVEKPAEKEETKENENVADTSSSEKSEENATNTTSNESGTQAGATSDANTTTGTEKEEQKQELTEKSEVELENDAEIKVIPLVFATRNGIVSKGNKVIITEIVGNWCHIESNAQDGWILKSKLESSIKAEAKEAEKKEETKQEDKKDESKEQEKSKEEGKKEEVKETKMYVSTTTLNVREKADTGAKVIDQLDINDQVTVTEKVDSTWSKVKVNGKTGYVATKYLSTKKTTVTSRSSDDVRKAESTKSKENTTNTNTTKTETTNNTNTNTTSSKTTTANSTTKTENTKTENSKTDTNKSETAKTETTKSNTGKTTDNSKTDTTTKTETKKEETKTETAKTTTKTESSSTKSSGTTGADIVAYAKKFLGYKYVYGTAGPNTFDCSGFTSYVYKHFGYSLNRTSGAQRSNGTAVSKANLKAGDIVCFSGHVGIYIGGNQFIHAANARKGVIISSLSESYYTKKYITARRIIN